MSQLEQVDVIPSERADLTAWRRRDELRRGSRTSPVPSGKAFRRKPKHPRRGLED